MPSKPTRYGVTVFRLSGKSPNPSFWGKPQTPKNEKQRSGAHMENENITVNRKRDILIRVFVTEAERDIIHEKMSLLNTNNFSAYARKILVDGYIINHDITELKTIISEMQKIGVNINQIARRVNTTSRIYEQDFIEIQRKVDDIWQLLKSSLSRQR